MTNVTSSSNFYVVKFCKCGSHFFLEGQIVRKCHTQNVCMQRKQNISVSCMEFFIVQELCESRGGRPGLSVLTSLLVSVDVKIY